VSGYLERLVGRHAGPSAVRPRIVSRFEGDLLGRPVGGDTSAPAGPPSAIATASSMETAAPPRPMGAAAFTVPVAPATARSAIATARVGTDESRPTGRAAPL
jgi:hypothetical protein